MLAGWWLMVGTNLMWEKNIVTDYQQNRVTKYCDSDTSTIPAVHLLDSSKFITWIPWRTNVETVVICFRSQTSLRRKWKAFDHDMLRSFLALLILLQSLLYSHSSVWKAACAASSISADFFLFFIHNKTRSKQTKLEHRLEQAQGAGGICCFRWTNQC